MSICNNCASARINPFGERVCNDHKNDPHYKLIYKSSAKKTFKITDAQLELLDFRIVQNPHRRSTTASLYRERDVIDAMKSVPETPPNPHAYTCPCGSVLASTARINAHNKTQKHIAFTSGVPIRRKPVLVPINVPRGILYTTDPTILARYTTLKQGLESVGLTLRSDSRFCEKYIRQGRPNLSVVILRMCQVKFLFEFKHIKTLLKTHAFDDAEQQILASDPYPNRFPWMTDAQFEHYARLLPQPALNTWTECPVCMTTRTGDMRMDGPILSDADAQCRHCLCETCWEHIYTRGKLECPLCRCDLSTWLSTKFQPIEECNCGLPFRFDIRTQIVSECGYCNNTSFSCTHERLCSLEKHFWTDDGEPPRDSLYQKGDLVHCVYVNEKDDCEECGHRIWWTPTRVDGSCIA